MTDREPIFSFGVWIKQRRRALGLTQQALARRIGVAEVTVRKIEADERRPSPQVAALLADELALDAPSRARFLLAARAELSPDQLAGVIAPPAAAPPLPPTTLIGREEALAALRTILADSTVRLLTLTGPPGIGKTRLALELAHSAGDWFGGAVTFVSLAPLSDPELVTAALVQALAVQPAPGEPPLRRLIAQLQGRRLLVLDNFEQVLAAADLVAELLASAADLRIVVTSRAALRLRAEHEYPVPPLALPAAPGEAALPALAELEAAPAVRLFVARARAVTPAFRLTAANAATVVAICARLDALPLALELAAARTRSFSLPTLLQRLDDHLDLLTDGPPDLPARQRTLRGAISWSYELLRPAERRLLEWLGTFVGGFTLDDLEGMLGRASATPDAPAAVEAGLLLSTLIDHSLVRVETDEQGGLRFSMLETVRAFARERLEATGGQLARRSHAEQFHALAAALSARLTTDERAPTLARLEGELDNLRAAFDWALGAGEAELALGLMDGAHALWVDRGRLAEGRTWAGRLLALPALGAPAAPRALALHRAADIAMHEGDYAAGIAFARESLAIFARLGERSAAAKTTTTLTWGLVQQGDHVAGMALAREVLAHWREAGDPLYLPMALAQVAWVHTRQGAIATAIPLLEESVALLRRGPHSVILGEHLWDLGELLRLQGEEARSKALFAESLRLMERTATSELSAHLHMRAWQAYRDGDYSQAAALFDENAALLRRQGDTIDLAWALNHAAAARHCMGELDRAAAGYAASLAHFRAHGHRQGEAAMLHNLGYIARSRGDLSTMAGNFQQSLATFRAVGYTWSVADAVAGLAAVAVARGDAPLAARLLIAAQAAHRAIDASDGLLDPSNMLEVGRTWAAIEASLGSEATRRLRAEHPLPLDEAADLAMGVG